MIKIEIITDKQQYDALWKQFKGHVFQSWAWGSSFAKATDDREVVAQKHDVVRLSYSIDGEQKGVLQIIIKSYINGLVRFGVIERAVLAEGCCCQLLPALKELITYELSLDFVLFEFNKKANGSVKKNKFIQLSGTTNQPQQTNVIDLTPTEEELFDKIRKTYKKHRNINVAKKKGVVVTRVDADEKNAQIFYDFMYKISKERGFHFLAKNHILGVIIKLGNDNLADIFLAHVDGALVGAYFVAYDETKAYELYGGVNLKGRKLFASYLLKWEAMLQAKSIGKVAYDQWGSAPKNDDGEYDSAHHLFHISKYKDSFGGEYFEFVPQKVMVVNRMKYQFFKLIKVLQKWKFKLGM